MLKDSSKVATYWRAAEALRQKNVIVEEERVVQVMNMMIKIMMMRMIMRMMIMMRMAKSIIWKDRLERSGALVE